VKTSVPATLTLACVLVGGAFALARPQEGSGRPGTVGPVAKKGDESVRARWERLRTEYIRLAAPLVEPLDGVDRLALLMQTGDARNAYEEAQNARKIAEIALTGYIEGTAKQELETAKGEIATAEESIKRAEHRLGQARIARQRIGEALAAKGNDLTATDTLARLLADRCYEDEELALARASFALKQATVEQEMLTKYKMNSRVLTLRADIKRKESDELRRESEWELAEGRELRSRRDETVVSEERKVLTMLGEAVRSPGRQPPWEREPAEFQAFLDQFEAKLTATRPLAEQAAEKRKLERFTKLTARILRELPKASRD
jgi:hypothetical protein